MKMDNNSLKYQRTAFSFIELILIVTFVGIFAVIAVPRFNYVILSKQKADITARKIVTDLRRTRSLAISDAANNTSGFSLSMIGGPYYTGYEIINLDTSVTVDSHNIDPEVSCKGHSLFEFTPLGNLKNGSGTELYVESDNKSITITIIPATGTIKCVEN